MKSHYHIFLLLIFLTSCGEHPTSSNSHKKIDSLNSLVNSLQSELTNTQLMVDSLTQVNQNKLTNEIIDSLEYQLKRKDVNFSALTQLQIGELQRLEEEDENDTWAYQYRIEIYGSEIYKSVYLTKIEFWGESIRRVGSTYEIDLDKEINVDGEWTNSLEFAGWLSPTEFQLSTSDSTYTFKILGPTNVIAKNP